MGTSLNEYNLIPHDPKLNLQALNLRGSFFKVGLDLAHFGSSILLDLVRSFLRCLGFISKPLISVHILGDEVAHHQGVKNSLHQQMKCKLVKVLLFGKRQTTEWRDSP